MTREEITGKRSLAFSQWIRDNLPDSRSGFKVSDLDWIFRCDNPYRMMIVEEKTYLKESFAWQRSLYMVIGAGLEAVSRRYGFRFLGNHTITFENTAPDDGNIYFDGKQITENQLREVLSLKYESYPPYY